jgi:hypothetical protein
MMTDVIGQHVISVFADGQQNNVNTNYESVDSGGGGTSSLCRFRWRLRRQGRG